MARSKNKPWLFKKGHKCAMRRTKEKFEKDQREKHYIRLTSDEYHRVAKNPVTIPQPTTSDVMLLRPRQKEVHILDKYVHSKCESVQECLRFVDLIAVCKAYHSANLEHKTSNPTCQEILFPLGTDEKTRGLGVEEVFSCHKCSYKSKKYKLYNEMRTSQRGRPAVKHNQQLQVGLFSTPISSTSIRKIFSCLDTTVPSESGLQKAANKVGPTIRKENINDMALQRRKVKRVLRFRGIAEDTPIPAEYDRQYNNPCYSRGKTPFQSGTQAKDILVENVTQNKYVIAYNFENKLCPSRSAFREDGTRNIRICPSKHSGCCATLPLDHTIGDEKSGGMKIASSLLSSAEPLKIGYITTDQGQYNT